MSPADAFRLDGRVALVTGSSTGLGLAIVKKIIDHYQGEIMVDPTARQGAKFLFSLPLPK